jgi:hypothetical protein
MLKTVLSPILVLPLNVGVPKLYKLQDIGTKSKKAKLQLKNQEKSVQICVNP